MSLLRCSVQHRLGHVLFVGALMLCGQAVCAEDAKTTFDLGFIASRYEDVNGDVRTKGIGPFFETAQNTNGFDLTAVRPFTSWVKDETNNRKITDYAWPIGNSRTIQDENYWRFLFFYGFNHTTNDPGDRYRTWLFPFYFQGRNASGDTYRALFPLAGTIDDFIGRDSLSFVLFPLYSTSKLNELSTVNFLWPLISKTTSKSGHIERGRVFPFYGYNRQEGKFNKRFILWPFYTDVTYNYKHSKGSGHILFPLYGRLKLNTENTWWVLPPFFRYTQGKDGSIVYAPWPFYQRRTSSDLDLRYVWPLWGRKKMGHAERTFVLWPIFWSMHEENRKTETDRLLAVPFYFSTTIRSRPTDDREPEVIGRRHKIWPIYSYRRNGDASQLRILDLWPFSQAASVERNWAPLWSLYTRERNGENTDHEILWGLYRNQRRGDEQRYVSFFPFFDYRRDDRVDRERRSWNILKGLVGIEREHSQSSLRLLYLFRIGLGKEETP